MRPDPARDPAAAFDRLYAAHVVSLTRQTFLLCGRHRLAERSVLRAFLLAWQRWPEVAVDPDPAGWVRAAAYEYALSPWHGLLPGRRGGSLRAVPPEDRPPLKALLGLPPGYRRALLLHDGLGLPLPETAAETEATTPAAASRVRHAREALAPWDDGRGPVVAGLLTGPAAARPVRPRPARAIRARGERAMRRWTLVAWAAWAAALALAATAAAPLLAR
ncbi:sigma factor-like helix-turn-helix DNA-binding protein [Streptomyces sp. URMC 129]|uniref:sigma factor-like helix-turn-helix DNA-binding protein n=1 Tax=Streptomyces sp. URMC 129 TaxID=3423407 RepID=UPI003F1AB1E5